MTTSFTPTHPAVSRFLDLRGLRHHLLVWGDLAAATPEAPLLLLVHGWMDVGASFQFAVDALRTQPGWAARPIVALDWRGFGLSDNAGADSYWFADYLADLDLLLDQLSDIADPHRAAQFVSTIALVVPGGQEHVVEGRWPGRLARDAAGSGGFGYDPIFIPDGQPAGAQRTAGELSAAEKNAHSHRARAFAALTPILAGL